jgi:hypothetical protein
MNNERLIPGQNLELEVEALDLNDLDTMEESFSPAMITGCGCGSNCSSK